MSSCIRNSRVLHLCTYRIRAVLFACVVYACVREQDRGNRSRGLQVAVLVRGPASSDGVTGFKQLQRVAIHACKQF